MEANQIAVLVFSLALAALLFIVLRVFNLWYFRINEKMNLLYEILGEMQKINDKLSANNAEDQ